MLPVDLVASAGMQGTLRLGQAVTGLVTTLQQQLQILVVTHLVTCTLLSLGLPNRGASQRQCCRPLSP